jgi:hypothetical protein
MNTLNRVVVEQIRCVQPPALNWSLVACHNVEVIQHIRFSVLRWNPRFAIDNLTPFKFITSITAPVTASSGYCAYDIEVVFLILRHLWLYLLLRLPVLYFHRVCWVFEDADLTNARLTSLRYSLNSNAPLPLETFPRRWNDLLVSFKAEWQVQGIVSALMLPHVLVLP